MNLSKIDVLMGILVECRYRIGGADPPLIFGHLGGGELIVKPICVLGGCKFAATQNTIEKPNSLILECKS
jgi:hypothetical protein